MTVSLKDPALIPRSEQIFTPEALHYVEKLHREFAVRPNELLAARRLRRDEVARTGRLDFQPEIAAIRDEHWSVAPAPLALQNRRVEITGPASPAKMAIMVR